MSQCHFCSKELPEPGCSHTIYAEGALHRAPNADGTPMELYTVCLACMKFHKLKPREIRREKHG